MTRQKVPESYFCVLFIIDSIKSPTKAISETKIPYKIPIKNGLGQFIKKQKVATEIEQIIPPIKPSMHLER